MLLPSYLRFNRTFMELKSGTPAGDEAEATGFNRTFMELKLVNATGSMISYLKVLIVPLWN